MRQEDIEPGRAYIGGKQNESRTVVSWGASRDWVSWAATREQLPLGGFVRTKCTSRASFAKWAKSSADEWKGE